VAQRLRHDGMPDRVTRFLASKDHGVRNIRTVGVGWSDAQTAG